MMTKTRQVYRCPICGNVVEVLHSGAVLSCCGQPMQLMEENATDGAYEKHVPVIEPIEGGYRVKVGSVEHPMMPEHYIEWIELLTPTDVLRHELKPGEKPEAIFMTDATEVTAREYCNLHGLLKGKYIIPHSFNTNKYNEYSCSLSLFFIYSVDEWHTSTDVEVT